MGWGGIRKKKSEKALWAEEIRVTLKKKKWLRNFALTHLESTK